jgi:hypothetical protein
VASFTPLPLYTKEKSPRYPLKRGLGGLQSWSGRGGEEKVPSPRPESNPIIPKLIIIPYSIIQLRTAIISSSADSSYIKFVGCNLKVSHRRHVFNFEQKKGDAHNV